MSINSPLAFLARATPGWHLAEHSTTGTPDDEDDRDDERDDENEAPIREVDDEDELGHPEDDDADDETTDS
jgi:hypothetical protein